MPQPIFRFVCAPAALEGAPAGWAAEMLRDGEIALLADESGFDAINAVAHALGVVSLRLVRSEESAERQQDTVIAYANALPLVWIGKSFSETVSGWGRARGAMTLLVKADGPLSDDERRRIDRFVATLGRQTE